MPPAYAVATGLLEGTLLALLGVILFELRHRAGMLPFGFLLAGLALMVPFTPKLASLALPGPWSVARSMAVVLPVLVGLVLVLDAFRGAFEARVGAGLPALAGGLVAAPALATTAIPVVLPEPLLPTPAQALVAGGTVSLALLGAAVLFELWHEHLAEGSPAPVLGVASLAGVVLHGVLHGIFGVLGLPVVGGAWPATVVAPALAGLAPVALVAAYTQLAHDRALALGEDPSLAARSPGLADLRVAEGRYADAMRGSTAPQAPARDPDRPPGTFVVGPHGLLLDADDVVAWMVGRPREALLGQPARAALGLDLADEGALDEGTHAARLRGPDGGARHLGLEVEAAETGARRVRVSDVTPEHLRERARRDRVRARFATRLVTREVPNRLAAPATHAEALADLLGPGGRSDDGAAHVAPDELARRLAGSLDGLERTLERVGPLDEPVPPDPGPIDLREALRAAVEALPPALRDELELRWELPEAATAPVRADDRIATVIEELLRNAHTHAGPEATVTVALDREGEGWTVSVADDGPGVPDGLKERVFEGFTRGAAGPAPGVGLALARVLVNAYGGRLWVEDRVPDRPEAGARFVVRLPAAEDPDAAPTDGETIHVAEAHRGPDPGG